MPMSLSVGERFVGTGLRLGLGDRRDRGGLSVRSSLFSLSTRSTSGKNFFLVRQQ